MIEDSLLLLEDESSRVFSDHQKETMATTVSEMSNRSQMAKDAVICSLFGRYNE